MSDEATPRRPGPMYVNRRGTEMEWSGIQTFMKAPVCLTPEDLRAGKVDVAVGGAPWDGTATGLTGTQLGPRAIRQGDYISGSRHISHLGVRVNPLDHLVLARLRRRRSAHRRPRRDVREHPDVRRRDSVRRGDPDHPGRRPRHHVAGRDRGRRRVRAWQSRHRALRRARRHRAGHAGLAARPRHADAAADRERRRAGTQLRAGRPARLLAGAAGPRSGWRRTSCAPTSWPRSDRDGFDDGARTCGRRGPRLAPTTSTSHSTSTWPTPRTRRAPGRRSRAG